MVANAYESSTRETEASMVYIVIPGLNNVPAKRTTTKKARWCYYPREKGTQF